MLNINLINYTSLRTGRFLVHCSKVNKTITSTIADLEIHFSTLKRDEKVSKQS
ncbi:hypothetical protein RchiOBHm_Chr3g0464801 [Rosa chinensis]|uniref:Uncharacterized protein n=1 Tax=Rosa chinensis TaxID=74649 RepID=A0A2P6R9J3_ROSCH|nr:hypothetical protein RchiOBHm_Chr3g0464801 [Rosa chinensis]